MKLRELVELAQKEPELLDYSLCLSQYMRVPAAAMEMEEEIDDGEDLTVVVDFPIRAILSNAETKEIRFALYNEDFEKLKDVDTTLREVSDDER